jgi:hypothetical protein
MTETLLIGEGKARYSRLVRITPSRQEKELAMRTIRRRNWLIRRVALGLAVAAFVAPVAQAGVDQGIGVPPSKQSVQAAMSRADIRQGIEMRRLDARYAGYLDDDFVGAHKPHVLGGALARGDSQVSPSVVASILGDQHSAVGDQPSATGFAWGDAAVGAGLALALVLLSGGTVLVTRRVSRAQTA